MIELNNGYPTNKTLDNIRAYSGDFNKLMELITPLFETYGKCAREDDNWVVVTGGWSGCESVVEALKENLLFWACCWRMSKVGGYFEFNCL